MIDPSTLREMCTPPRPGMPYFRPLVCKGELSDVDVFLVGTKPATQIRPRDMSLEKYAESLLDYGKFRQCYECIRLRQGKESVSPTSSIPSALLRKGTCRPQEITW